MQQLRTTVDEVSYKIHAQDVDLRLLEERLGALEEKLQRQEGKPKGGEGTQRDLVVDIKTLKGHLEKTQSDVLSCEKRLSQLDKQVEKDLSVLKEAMQSMLVLLKGEGEKCYTVKSGDSLGQIAQNHRTSTKVLKELNMLSSDTIFVGQQLKLP